MISKVGSRWMGTLETRFATTPLFLEIEEEEKEGTLIPPRRPNEAPRIGW